MSPRGCLRKLHEERITRLRRDRDFSNGFCRFIDCRRRFPNMESFIAAANARALDCAGVGLGTQVELHGMAAELNGKRGHVVELVGQSAVVVSIAFLREAGAVKIKRKRVQAANLKPVSEIDSTASSFSIPSRRHDDASNARRVCFVECSIADVAFTERLDSQRNPGWFRVPLELFVKQIFEAVMTRGAKRSASDLPEARRRVLLSQLFCGRLRIDGTPIPWTASMDLLSGDALPGGATADRPHRIEVHLDLCAPPRLQKIILPSPAALASAHLVEVREKTGEC